MDDLIVKKILFYSTSIAYCLLGFHDVCVVVFNKIRSKL